MSASAETTRSARGRRLQVWRPADVLFLLVSLAGLAAGLFPECLVPAHVAASMTVLPALGALLAVQAAFLAAVCPVVLAGRARPRPAGPEPGASPGPTGPDSVRPGRNGRGLLGAPLEFALCLAASVPLYAVAAWVSDAGASDVVRGLLYLAGVGLWAWGLGWWTAGGRSGMTAFGVLLALGAGLGLPVLCYLAAELTNSPVWVQRLWLSGPATCAFSLPGAAGGQWDPSPLWAWCLWPAAGGVLALARLVMCPPRRG